MNYFNKKQSKLIALLFVILSLGLNNSWKTVTKRQGTLQSASESSDCEKVEKGLGKNSNDSTVITRIGESVCSTNGAAITKEQALQQFQQAVEDDASKSFIQSKGLNSIQGQKCKKVGNGIICVHNNHLNSGDSDSIPSDNSESADLSSENSTTTVSTGANGLITSTKTQTEAQSCEGDCDSPDTTTLSKAAATTIDTIQLAEAPRASDVKSPTEDNNNKDDKQTTATAVSANESNVISTQSFHDFQGSDSDADCQGSNFDLFCQAKKMATQTDGYEEFESEILEAFIEEIESDDQKDIKAAARDIKRLANLLKGERRKAKDRDERSIYRKMTSALKELQSYAKDKLRYQKEIEKLNLQNEMQLASIGYKYDSMLLNPTLNPMAREMILKMKEMELGQAQSKVQLSQKGLAFIHQTEQFNKKQQYKYIGEAIGSTASTTTTTTTLPTTAPNLPTAQDPVSSQPVVTTPLSLTRMNSPTATMANGIYTPQAYIPLSPAAQQIYQQRLQMQNPMGNYNGTLPLNSTLPQLQQL